MAGAAKEDSPRQTRGEPDLSPEHEQGRHESPDDADTGAIVEPIGLVCSCGARSFARLRFGGNVFRLKWFQRWGGVHGGGFKPEIYACRQCRRITFRLPDGQSLDGD